MTTRHGYRYSTSVGGTLTGRGGNFIIIDDPIKPEDAMSDAKRSTANDWFARTAYSRLDDKRNDVIILIKVDSVSRFLSWIDQRRRNRMWVLPLEL